VIDSFRRRGKIKPSQSRLVPWFHLTQSWMVAWSIIGVRHVFFTEVRGAASNSAYYGYPELWIILLTDTTSCLCRDSNPWPSGWESDILTIRPWRPTSKCCGFNNEHWPTWLWPGASLFTWLPRVGHWWKFHGCIKSWNFHTFEVHVWLCICKNTKIKGLQRLWGLQYTTRVTRSLFGIGMRQMYTSW
jgi:hypothetical protein